MPVAGEERGEGRKGRGEGMGGYCIPLLNQRDFWS